MLSQSKYLAGLSLGFLGKKPQNFMIPIYSTAVLYDTVTKLFFSFNLCTRAKINWGVQIFIHLKVHMFCHGFTVAIYAKVKHVHIIQSMGVRNQQLVQKASSSTST